MNTYKLNNYPFSGWDFMELAEAWNVYVGDSIWIEGKDVLSDSDMMSEYLKGVLGKYGGRTPTRVMRKHAKDIRIFAKALSQGLNSYDAPLWSGMAQIEDDWTLINYAIKLMAAMWN